MNKKLAIIISLISSAFFWLIILITSVIIMLTDLSNMSEGSINADFSFSENVRLYETPIREQLTELKVDESYANYILALMEVLTKGEGIDILNVNEFDIATEPVTEPTQSLRLGVDRFIELLIKVDLPLILEEEETAEPDKIKKAIQAYAYGDKFLDYIKDDNYSQDIVNQYATANNIDDTYIHLGEDVYITYLTCSENDTLFIHPVPGYDTEYWITSYWGDGRNHKGLDFAAPEGTPIVATRSGTVIVSTYASDWGYYVKVKHDDTYDTLSAHMVTRAVSVGEYVEKGQIIGYVGNTGYSFGNHLHFEIYMNGIRIDPYPYIKDSLREE